MNSFEFEARLVSLAKAIEEEGLKIAETYALTGLSLVKARVLEEGVGEYSTKYVPAFFLYGKARNRQGEAYLQDNDDKDDLVSWGEFRKAQGLQNDHVDLSYTGRMWAGIHIMQKTKQGTRSFIRLGGSDQEVDEKLDWNTKRYGDFLAPNAAEKAELDQYVDDAYTTLINNFLK